MSLRSRIHDDMKIALKAGETVRLGAIRLLMAAIRQKEVDERIELDDKGIIAIIEKMVKRGKESLNQFEAAKRLDLAAKERQEIDVLCAYLPKKMSVREIDAAIDAAFRETGATTVADMGRIMSMLKAQLGGKADMGMVSGRVKARLG
ncbi:MAG: GatB/YqeY domain-containing protein [Zoogloeaceae bacterium]|nr:GatB/YqeY domain-containing protein [Zoogloeaceae bacterium]